MSASLDHMIVFARDRDASAAYLAEMLGTPEPTKAGHFTQVQIDHGLTVDFMNTLGNVATQHYAFLVSDAQFDAAFARIRERNQTYWARPLSAPADGNQRAREPTEGWSISRIRAVTFSKYARNRRVPESRVGRAASRRNAHEVARFARPGGQDVVTC